MKRGKKKQIQRFNNTVNETSWDSLATVIDSKYEDFVLEAVKLSVGNVHSLCFILTNVYRDLYSRKEAIMKSKSLKLADKQNSILSLYAEMQKIEDKVTYLKNREMELSIPVRKDKVI